MYPKDFRFDQHKQRSQTCFVLMPFDTRFDKVYAAIREGVAQAGFASCMRADDISRGGHIMDDVLKGIAEAEVIVADVTGNNENVFYEIGITHMIRDVDSVVVLCKATQKLAFDIGQFRCIQYEDGPDGLEQLRRQIASAIRSSTPADLRFNIDEGQEYSHPERLPGADRYLYEVGVRVMATGRGFAKFIVNMRRFGNLDGIKELKPADYGVPVGQGVLLSGLGWTLNLDDVVNKTAHFCLCEPGKTSK